MKKLFEFFTGKKTYRRPTREEIHSVDFKFDKTLKDLLLYDKGKLRQLDRPTKSGGLRDYLRTRKAA
jgi:hypothetical protein